MLIIEQNIKWDLSVAGQLANSVATQGCPWESD